MKDIERLRKLANVMGGLVGVRPDARVVERERLLIRLLQCWPTVSQHDIKEAARLIDNEQLRRVSYDAMAGRLSFAEWSNSFAAHRGGSDIPIKGRLTR